MGITPTGYELKTLREWQDEIEADQLAEIDPALDLSPDQPLGQLNAIAAKKLAEQDEIQQTLANAMNPASAENFLLDNICLLTGTLRRPKSKSVVTLSCNVGAGFTAPAASMMANVAGDPDRQFVNVGAVDLTGEPAGVYPIQFECTVFGPVSANAGTITVITNAVSGWNSCTNALDAVLGRHDETDAELRKRRQDELTAPGACTVDSIRADVLKVPGVLQCYVFENVTLDTDSNGLPGKSLEVVIYDGPSPAADDEAIAQVVWDSKPSGAETYGAIEELVRDSLNQIQAVKFSRAEVVPVWLEYDLTIDPNWFPSNGATLVKTAAATYAAKYLNLGVDVFAVAFKAQAITVPGVLDVTALRLGFASSPTGTVNLTITGREIASIDTARITVAVTPGSP
jgi:uncharacterized phage protein gp47/JayE